MAHRAVCLESEILVQNASVDDVVKFCEETLRKMRLKTEKEESTPDGKTVIFAREGALVPLLLKTLLYPLSLNEYVQRAQRSGVHIAVSPREDGVHVFSCGIALDETSGKTHRYDESSVLSEVTDTMEAWDFESKFVKRILEHFPEAKRIR